MTGLRRWRFAAVALALGSALAAVGAARWAAVRFARAGAERLAGTTAAYLSIVTPPARGGRDYNLSRLFIQARALARLSDWAPDFEVYHHTAPLVDAAAGPLAAAQFDDLRRRETVRWAGGRAVVPLKDRDDWDVVGAVAMGPEAVPGPSGLAAVALALTLLAGWLVVAALGRGEGGEKGGARGAATRYAVSALLLGAATYGDVRHAAAASTERWLVRTRLLIQEAAQRLPPIDAATLAVTLARIAPGAALTAGDSGNAGVRFEPQGRGGSPQAVVAARVGPGRWLALATTPAQATTGGWLPLCLGLAALGPLLMWGLAWAARERANPRRRRETLVAWGFLAPATLHLAVFSLGPIAFALILAVHRWSLVEPVKTFVGLDNFIRLAHDPLVWISLRNTALYAVHVPVTMAIALGVALLLRRHTRLARFARTAFFLPYVSSVVAIALVWQWIYHADFGLLNYALSFIGVAPVDWLGSPKTALLAVMLMSVWVQVGYQMVVFLAGLQGIPQTYLDAAVVDGANAWQRFWKVTFPLLRPVTLFVLVTGIISSFQVFTYIYVLTDGGPLHATDVIVYRIYQTAWEFLQFGYASALALLLFVVLFGVTWTQFRLLGKPVEYA